MKKSPGNNPIRRIVIIGSGLDAWMTATALKRYFDHPTISISVLETSTAAAEGLLTARPDTGPFLSALGIPEDILMRETGAQRTWGWTAICKHTPQEVFLPYSAFGKNVNGIGFHHYWCKARRLGEKRPLSTFSLATRAHQQERAAGMKKTDPAYGYTIPAKAFDALFNGLAQSVGIQSIKLKPGWQTEFSASNDQIEAITTPDGARIVADLYVDATGAERALITRLKGSEVHAGIPGFATDEGQQTISAIVRPWCGNCLAMGRSAVDLSSYGGVQLHLLQEDIMRLVGYMPSAACHPDEIREYNRLATEKMLRIFDMITLLHGSDDQANFSTALQRKINAFKARGRIAQEDYETYTPQEWIAAMLAQKFLPERFDPLVETLSERALTALMEDTATAIEEALAGRERGREHLT